MWDSTEMMTHPTVSRLFLYSYVCVAVIVLIEVKGVVHCER